MKVNVLRRPFKPKKAIKIIVWAHTLKERRLYRSRNCTNIINWSKMNEALKFLSSLKSFHKRSRLSTLPMCNRSLNSLLLFFSKEKNRCFMCTTHTYRHTHSILFQNRSQIFHASLFIGKVLFVIFFFNSKWKFKNKKKKNSKKSLLQMSGRIWTNRIANENRTKEKWLNSEKKNMFLRELNYCRQNFL